MVLPVQRQGSRQLLQEHCETQAEEEGLYTACVLRAGVCAGCLQATEALRITSSELVTFGVMDTVIEEPLGGAHADPMGAFPAIKTAIMKIYNDKCATSHLLCMSLCSPACA